MTESERPLEGSEADRERARLRDERLAQGAVSWRTQFLRCFDREAEDER